MLGNNERIPSIDLVLEEMNEQRKIQSSASESLDQKAGILMGFIFTSAMLYFVNVKPITSLGFFLYLVIIIGFSLSLCVIWTAYYIRRYWCNPSPESLKDDYMFREPIEKKDDKAGAKEQILVDQVDAYGKNRKVIDDKANKIRNGMLIFLITFVVITISFICNSFSSIYVKQGGSVMCSKDESKNLEQKTEPANQKPAEPNPAAENIIRKGGLDKETTTPNKNAENILKYTETENKSKE